MSKVSIRAASAAFVCGALACARALPVASALAATRRAASPAAVAPPAGIAATAAQLRDRALAGQSVAYDVIAELTSEIGGRPAGSPALARAKDWGVAKLSALGYSNVHVEPFTKRDAWLRGAESASVVAPIERPLLLLALGNSVPTPAGGIEAEVVAFPSLEALIAAAPGSLAGRIALVNQPMTRTQTGSGYGAAVRARALGPSLAAARGALAYLTRSAGTGDSRLPHTGATIYDEKVAKIPAAALGYADADLLTRLAASGRPVRVRLALASTVIAEAPAWNVVGEIPGREPGAGTIVIGGHLDSWDPGQGALDDGAGIGITIAAAKLIAELPVRPRRTLRVVLWGSEETGGSGDAYGAAHVADAPGIALAGESDLGADRLYELQLPKGLADDPALAGLATVLAPLGIYLSSQPATDGGADVSGLRENGVPVFEFGQDASRYFDLHHTADDTFDKVNRANLDQNVAAWSALLWYLAESGVDARAAAARARP